MPASARFLHRHTPGHEAGPSSVPAARFRLSSYAGPLGRVALSVGLHPLCRSAPAPAASSNVTHRAAGPGRPHCRLAAPSVLLPPARFLITRVVKPGRCTRLAPILDCNSSLSSRSGSPAWPGRPVTVGPIKRGAGAGAQGRAAPTAPPGLREAPSRSESAVTAPSADSRSYWMTGKGRAARLRRATVQPSRPVSRPEELHRPA